MDLNQLKKLIYKENAKVIIVENGEPILVVSKFKESGEQLSLHPISEEQKPLSSSLIKDEGLDKKEEIVEDIAVKPEKIIQDTEVLTKEELPADELTVEDLPF